MMNLGLGTAAIGRPEYINIRKEADDTRFDLAAFKAHGRQLLEQAYNVGIRYFDTAPGYGMAEELLIDWVADKQDPAIEVATKWGYTYTADFKPNAETHEVKEHSLARLNEQWEQSKKLLPCLSTYQIHSATFETGVLENRAVLEQLAEIKTTHGLKIGATVGGDNQLEVLQSALEVEVGGQQLFEVFQVTYNILDQSIAPILKDAAMEGKRFVIKEGLANGRLLPNKRFAHYNALYEYLGIVARKYGASTDAVALRFCMDSVRPFIVLSGASEKEHLADNLMANNFELSEEELHTLEHFKMAPEKYWQERKSLPWN